MKQLIRRFSRVVDYSSSNAAPTTSYCLLRSEITALRAPGSDRRRKRRSGVPSGHVPVYVGEEMERFSVSADLLNHPVFVKLLNRSAQEYGYDQKGVLHIPCHVSVFESVLHALRPGGPALSSHVLRLIDSL